MVTQQFHKLTTDYERFFEILPSEWNEIVVPFWQAYEKFSSIYVLAIHSEIIAGGIVFTSCPPDLIAYKNDLQHWFDKGYFYLGFIFVKETMRGQNLGSTWLDAIKKQYPNQKFWLLIEDDHLHHFYIKNGFQRIQDFQNGDQTEGLYVYTNEQKV